MKIRKLTCLMGFVLTVVCTTYGQQIIVNSEGEKIIMYPDGSWRALDAQDSILLKQYLQKSESLQTLPGTPEESAPRTKAEEQSFLIRQSQDLRSRILAQLKKVQDEFRDATNAKFRAGELLHNAEANKNLIEPDRWMTLNQEYESSVERLRNAKLNQMTIKKLAEKANSLTADPNKTSKSKFNQLQSKYNIYLAHFEHVIPERSNAPWRNSTLSQPQPNPSHPLPEAKPVQLSTPMANPSNVNAGITVTPNAPPYSSRTYAAKPFDCKINVDTIDQESKRRQIEVAPDLIFTYTDPDLRPFFKDKELITCTGKVMKVGPYVYLTVEFQIASSHSQNNFGSLQNGSLFRIKLLSGEYVSLYNLKADRGHLDPYSGNTIFTGQYALGKDEIKKLKSHELDKIRVLWATGFEDYDVYAIDFFIHQLDCLSQY